MTITNKKMARGTKRSLIESALKRNKTVHYINFTIEGNTYTVITKKHLERDEFEMVFFYTRRLIGYGLYPRWATIRLFLAEVIEMLKNNKLYNHQIRKQAKALIEAFDKFERRHTKEFYDEWIEIVGSHLAGKVYGKVNELRGDIGGVLLNHGVKNYLIFSYPEMLVSFCDQAVTSYDYCMKDVEERFGCDFSEVFEHLKGKELLNASLKLLSAIEDTIGERLPVNIDASETVCRTKMRNIHRELTNTKNIQEAIREAYDEMPEDIRKETAHLMGAFSDEEDETANIIETLSQKYNVKAL